MDMNTDPTSLPFLLLLLLPVVVLISSALLLLRRRRQTAHNSFPPGSEGWPLVGETLQMISANKTEEPMSFVDERVRRYGRIFATHLLGERTVYSADPEFNQLVMNGEGRFFETSYPPAFTTLVGSCSMINLKGRIHKRMHSLTITRFSSSTIMLQLLPEMDRLVRRTLDSWQEGRTVQLQVLIKKMNFKLFMKQMIGEDPGEWMEALRKEFVLFVDGFFAIPLPSFLSSFSRHGRAVQAGGKVREEMLRVVKKRGVEKKGTEAADMLDEVMAADKAFEEEERLGEAGIAEFLVSLLAAGYDNTSTVMTVAIKFLTENPRALAQIREENEQIVRVKKKKHDDSLDWSDYMAMPFTHCVINETLRMSNVAAGPWRRAVTDIQFKGYTIPKGCKVHASTQAVHLDHENFKDARTFDPWRWLGGKKDINANLLAPFGGGSRLCPGLKLAQVQISVFLHHFVTRFDWEVAEKDKMVFFPTARTLKGYPIILSHSSRNIV